MQKALEGESGVEYSEDNAHLASHRIRRTHTDNLDILNETEEF